MVGDNDAGAFATYGQAGQDYGTRLLWTLLLLVPVLYVNQEMVLRLGAVTGVGHARLILERFGRFWGAFSVIDLFMLNALTIVTEFIGITPGRWLPRACRRSPAVALAALVIIGGGVHRQLPPVRADRGGAVRGSAAADPGLLPVPPGRLGRWRAASSSPQPARRVRQLSTVMLLIIAIVGTTVAPWQLFFQQSYVIDKRITPRFIRYEKADLWIGIVVVDRRRGGDDGRSPRPRSPGTPAFGHFTDAGGRRRRPAGPCRPRGRGAVRGGAAGRLDHRRVRGRRCPPRTRSATCSASGTRCTAACEAPRGSTPSTPG